MGEGYGFALQWADKYVDPIQGRQERRDVDVVVQERAEVAGTNLQGRLAMDCRYMETEWREVSRDQHREREWGYGLVQR